MPHWLHQRHCPSNRVKNTSATITLVIPAAPGVAIDTLECANRQTRPIEILVEEGTHPSINRNRGAARATTPLIAFTNAHTLLREDWAARAEEFFLRHPEIDIVGGPQLNYAHDPYFARLSGDALSSPFCTGQMSRRYRVSTAKLDADEDSVTSANLICRRQVFERIRFDETLYPGEDPKFVTDAKRAGFTLAYVPDIVVFNRRRASMQTLARQIFNYGAARVQKETLGELLRHPEFFAPTALVLYLLLLPLWLLWNCWLLLPLVAYVALAVIFAGQRTVERRRPEYLLLLPIMFLWIHMTYGLGFLIRLLQGGFRQG